MTLSGCAECAAHTAMLSYPRTERMLVMLRFQKPGSTGGTYGVWARAEEKKGERIRFGSAERGRMMGLIGLGWGWLGWGVGWGVEI